MQIAERTRFRPLFRVREVTRRICALPAVATLDWCDRAAACLCHAGPPGSTTALFMVCTLDGEGQILTRDAVGVAAVPGGGESPAADEDPVLTGLRSRGHRLQSIGTGGNELSHRAVVVVDNVAPEWRSGPLGRLIGAQCPGELVAAVAPLAGEPGRAVVAYIAGEGDAGDLVAVLEAIFPLLAARASECLGATQGNPRSWLTVREQEVLEQLTLGRSVKEIAETLGRSPHTVHDHVKALHRKLNATTRGELIARALGHIRVPAPDCVEPKPLGRTDVLDDLE